MLLNFIVLPLSIRLEIWFIFHLIYDQYYYRYMFYEAVTTAKVVKRTVHLKNLYLPTLRYLYLKTGGS